MDPIKKIKNDKSTIISDREKELQELLDHITSENLHREIEVRVCENSIKETNYLNSIPGLAESITELKRTSNDKFSEQID